MPHVGSEILFVLLALTRNGVHEAGGVRTTCPGSMAVPGYGQVSLANAMWKSSGHAAGPMEETQSEILQPHQESRTYFADWCQNATHSNTWYSIFKLLGKRLLYTVDLSGASCGCHAALSLVPMFQNTEPSECGDFYCDARSTCGVGCHEVIVQEANSWAWHSMLRRSGDVSNAAVGYGGQSQDFGPEKYGQAGSCIDTRTPFQVSAYFPVDSQGILAELQVELSQEGKPCRLPMHFQGDVDLRTKITAILEAGVTPVVRYSGQRGSLAWLKGPSETMRLPCELEESQCAEFVSFHSFLIEDAETLQARQEKTPTLPMERQCVDGLQQPDECQPVFWMGGKQYTGCVREMSIEPWCSKTKIYEGAHSLCKKCGSGTSSTTAGSTPGGNAARTVTPNPLLDAAEELIQSRGGEPQDNSDVCSWPLRLTSKPTVSQQEFQWIEQLPGWVALFSVSNSRYVTAEEDGTLSASLKAMPPRGGIFRVLWRANDSLVLRTEFGHYVTTLPDGSVGGTHSMEEAQQLQLHERANGMVFFSTVTATGLADRDQQVLVTQGRFCAPGCAKESSARFAEGSLSKDLTVESDASSCQARCRTTQGCTYFTYIMPDHSCHLAGSEASKELVVLGALSGPASCDGLFVVRRYADHVGGDKIPQSGLGKRLRVPMAMLLIAPATLVILLVVQSQAPNSARIISRSDLQRLSVEEGDGAADTLMIDRE